MVDIHDFTRPRGRFGEESEPIYQFRKELGNEIGH